ncbi:unnamed protein product [Aphanomyces euteiches]
MVSRWTWLVVSWCVVSTKPLRSSKVFLLPEEKRHHLGPVLAAFDRLGVNELEGNDVMAWGAAASPDEFDIVWSYEYTDFGALGPLASRHKVNHLPGNYAIVSKGHVYSTQLSLQQLYGKEHFDFIPQQYRLPDERDQFLAAFDTTNVDTKLGDSNYGRRWLIKNQNHRGVHFFSGLDQLNKYMTTNDMVAQCIEPLLISGHKFDIGLYVTIASVDPLRVYIYQNALLRMCKLKYPTDLNDTTPLESYVVDDYLPPWEIPDLKPFYDELPSIHSEGTSHFAVLKQYLTQLNIDPDQFQKDIYGAVVKLITGNRDHFKRMEATFRHELKQPGRGNFFEMYRFDFLVDDKGKPWLMETNQSPNLAPKFFESGTDAKMKENIVYDLLHLIGIQSPAEAMHPHSIFQADGKYCHSKCQDTQRIYDMTCWRCPGWFSPPEADILYESSVEFLRRGRFNLVFPTLDDAYVPFLDGGRTTHDIAFSRYVQSLVEEKLALNDAIVCASRGHCSSHGNCVNGQCVCDTGFQGLLCADAVNRLDLNLPKVNNSNNLKDDLEKFHSANLRVVGAAAPQDTSNLAIVILVIGNTVVVTAIYVVAKFMNCKKGTVKEH